MNEIKHTPYHLHIKHNDEDKNLIESFHITDSKGNVVLESEIYDDIFDDFTVELDRFKLIVHCVNTYSEREALIKEMKEALEAAEKHHQGGHSEIGSKIRSALSSANKII
jgi:hypothetical protein